MAICAFMRDKIFAEGFWFAIKSGISSNFVRKIIALATK